MTNSFTDVSTSAQLSADIATIDGESTGNGTDFSITLAAGATSNETASMDSVDLKSGDTLTINGQGATINGGDAYRGLFVYAGAVTIENLTISDAAAIGGAGGSGDPGGGGAGLGGGLFVGGNVTGDAGAVTLDNVNFSGDTATGGAGGVVGAIGGGGGGGLGSAGGPGAATAGSPGYPIYAGVWVQIDNNDWVYEEVQVGFVPVKAVAVTPVRVTASIGSSEITVFAPDCEI